MIIFLVFIGLALGNFGYQEFAGHNWHLAFERTFFQAAALLAYWSTNHLVMKNG